MAAILGSALVAIALAIIWLARVSVDRALYVSALGAEGEPTSAWFNAALRLLAVGGLCVAGAAHELRASRVWLSVWSPSASIIVSSSLFLLAAQVTCTTGCPLPVGAAFTWQDLIHTCAAVLAFGFAGYAMLQVSFAGGHRTLRVVSMGAGIATSTIAGVGGMLSLLRFRTDIGSMLELVATTVGIGWLIMLGIAAAHAYRPGRAGQASTQIPFTDDGNASARQSGIPERRHEDEHANSGA